MPVTSTRPVTWQTWRQVLATTTSDETVTLVTVELLEDQAAILRLFVVVSALDGSNAAFYDAEALWRRETGLDIVLVSSPLGHQVTDGDFTPQNPDLTFGVDVGIQSAIVTVDGILNTPLKWLAEVLVIRRF
jgi:hypothetical protein